MITSECSRIVALLKFRGASLNLNWKVNAVLPSWEAGGS